MSEETVDRCPLCPTNLPLVNLYPHVAQHLEQLSLFVLSSYAEDPERTEEGSDASDKAHDDRSRRLDYLSDDSTTARSQGQEANGQELDFNMWDDGTEPNTVSEGEGAPPALQGLQDWTSVMSQIQTSAPKAGFDPLLLDMQRKQDEQVHGEISNERRVESRPAEEGPAELQAVEEIYDLVEANMVEKRFRGEMQRYVPKSTTEQVASRAVIEQVLDQDKSLFLYEPALRSFVTQIFTSCRIMFVICVWSGSPMALLKALVDHGLSDARLPFKLEDCLTRPRSQRFYRGFLRGERMLCPAYFELGSFQSLDDDRPIPIDFDESNIYRHDALGELVEVRVDPNQHDFPEKDEHFDMRISSNDSRYAQLRKSLPAHSHLVDRHASFVHWKKLYVLYQKADLNLEEYMEINTVSPLDVATLVSQLRGITEAVSVLRRHFSLSSPIHKSPPLPQNTWTGMVQSAITPDDILVFRGQDPLFRLSTSFSDDAESAYRAPEFAGPASCRPQAVVWSLGCTYMELLVWHLRGHHDLKTFRETREQVVRPDGTQDQAFFYFAERGPTAKAQIREPVVKTFATLLGQAEEPVRSVVRVVKAMLRIDPTSRPSMADVETSLKKLVNSISRPDRLDIGWTPAYVSISPIDSDVESEDAHGLNL